MSRARTKSTESAGKRGIFDVLRDPHVRGRRVTRAEFTLSELLLEYKRSSGANLKWCGLYYGGESRAG